ncbi:MAG TPA: alkaline phosphatase family protein [Amycolatopsis sp.]|uniref:alkaline phosphatase family protein n=1 Tax=Amycolatopsis sp. TaxID=37632 RepID=UPI002B49BCDC|nr:alkaline phosphatase family protein [Amycolatopsis sp.]HKS49304.1 alkaline phosphatase family protein [Amycolatopsis sp.]
MAELTRRRLLKTGAAVVGAAAVSMLPPNLAGRLRRPEKPGKLADIEHVVVLMQENRSFDHYFGTLQGVRGFGDPDAITLDNGKSVFHQPDPKNPAGYLLPFHLDTRRTSAQAIPSTSHAFSVQHAAWNGGKMDNWLPAHREADGDAHGPYTMGYYTRDDIPFHFALAEAFTVCDAYHCSVLGPTWPNRLYHMTGTIDPAGDGGGPITSNMLTEPYRWTTYPERLTEAGVSWHVYQQEDDYGCNPLELFENFQDADASSPLHQHGLVIGPADQFEQDALADRLPAVSWIIPTSAQCEHPAYLPAAGADFVASKLDAVAANPDVWRKTVFILNYDENDGLFDHVPPPTPPPGTDGEFVDGVPIGAGMRVPCVIVSPWTQGGWVARERFDHTSVLRFLELFTGVREPNITEWRRETFGDLTSALGHPAGRPFPALPPTKDPLWRAGLEVATLPPVRIPGAAQTPPAQEAARPRPAAASRRQPVSRVTESLTTHRADFPDGVAGTSFPGIQAAALAAAASPKSTASHAYVTMINSFAVAVLDTAKHELVKGIGAGANPYGIAATPDRKRLFVTNSGGSDVSVLDPATDKVGATITVGPAPHGIAMAPDGRYAYVANTGPETGSGGSGSVSVLDVAARKVAGVIDVGPAPRSVAVSPDGTKLFVSCADQLSIVDTGTRMARAGLAQAARANGVAISPDGTSLYLAGPGTNTVTVVDTSAERVVASIPVGYAPWQVAFHPGGAFAYVSNANSDTVSVIETSRRAVIATILVDHIPTGLYVTTDTLWVATNASSTVQAVSLARLEIAGRVSLGLTSQPASIVLL